MEKKREYLSKIMLENRQNERTKKKRGKIKSQQII